MANLKDKIVYQSIDDMEVSPFWTTVLYGETGKRKTTTACEMVKKSGILLCADDSWKILHKGIHIQIKNKVRLVEYEGLTQIENLDFTDVDTVILDPINAMVEDYLDLLFEKANWGGKYRDILSTTDPRLKGTSTTAPIDYKVTRDKFRPIFRGLVRAPVHVIFTAHVANPIPGLSKDLTKRPSLPEATWNVLARFADVVAFLEGNDKKGFTANVDESVTYCVAKSRIEGISGKMDLGKFVDAYHDANG
jgi:hypothetical protein